MLGSWRTVVAVALVSFCSTSHAQEQPISLDAQPSPVQIDRWLQSGDARLEAWGAYFASAGRVESATQSLLKLASAWKAEKSHDAAQEVLRSDAMRNTLDALIQNSIPVPRATLAAVAESFPNQAAILAARLTGTDEVTLLLSWYGDGTQHTNVLPRVAAMMLAKAPPPGFAASVVSASRASYSVTVIDGGGAGGGYGGAGCGDGFGGLTRSGWPPIAYYHLEENKQLATDPLVTEAGGDRITYRRMTGEAWGSCFGVRALSDQTRYDLLVEMLGIAKKDMQWQVHNSTSIVWTDSETFEPSFEEGVSQMEAELHSTVEALFEKGYLSVQEAAAVRTKLAVFVEDKRQTRQPILAVWEPRDLRTTVTYGPEPLASQE